VLQNFKITKISSLQCFSFSQCWLCKVCLWK